MIILMQQMFLMSRYLYETLSNPSTRSKTIEVSWRVWSSLLRMYRNAAFRFRRLRFGCSERGGGLLRDVIVRGIKGGPEGFAAAADDAVSVVMSEVMSEAEIYESCESDLDLEQLAGAEEARRRQHNLLTKGVRNAAALKEQSKRAAE